MFIRYTNCPIIKEESLSMFVFSVSNNLVYQLAVEALCIFKKVHVKLFTKKYILLTNMKKYFSDGMSVNYKRYFVL